MGKGCTANASKWASVGARMVCRFGKSSRGSAERESIAPKRDTGSGWEVSIQTTRFPSPERRALAADCNLKTWRSNYVQFRSTGTTL